MYLKKQKKRLRFYRNPDPKDRDAKGLTQIVTEKKLAAYHQYYAVNKAVESSIKASGAGRNKKGWSCMAYAGFR